MIIKKNRAVSLLPANAILNCEDRKKFSAFVALLVQVNKRINPSTQELRRTRPEEYAVTAKTRSKKKIKEYNLENLYKEGSQPPTSLKLRRTGGGPCFLRMYFFTLKTMLNYILVLVWENYAVSFLSICSIASDIEYVIRNY